MRLYLDDNLADRALAGSGRRAGHTVFRPADFGLIGVSDARHLERAIREELVLLTEDRKDFQDLHQLGMTSGGSHPGILLIRNENDPKRDMKPKHILAAIQKFEESGISVINQVIILNQWR